MTTTRNFMASTLQIDSSKAGTSAVSPLAETPVGQTPVDNYPHVKVAESSTTDVTTSFVGSQVVEKSDQTMTTFDAPKYISAMSTDFIMTLKKALCRPVALASGSWATTDLVGADLKNGQLPEDLLSLAIVSRKLDGFQGIRGSITLRLQATANPFQQGRLKLLFYPMADDDVTYPFRSASPAGWSFWPSVDLDLGVETACELRVPFVLPVSFCDLVTPTASQRPQMGRYMVRVYSGLQVGGGTNTVGWNLYAHWNEDDLQIINPTVNSFQSGQTKPLVATATLTADVLEGLAQTVENCATAKAVAFEKFFRVLQLLHQKPEASQDIAHYLRRCRNYVSSHVSADPPSVDAQPNARAKLHVMLQRAHKPPYECTFRNEGSVHAPRWICQITSPVADATGGPFSTKVEAEESAAQEIVAHLHTVSDTLSLFNVPQSGHTKKLVGKKSPPAEAEKKSHSISGALSAGATVLDVASHIPVLSDFAGPTAWALRAASKVASVFGFSRPPIDEVPRLITPYSMPFASNVEGPDVSMPLSLTTQPSLKFEPTLSGKNEDEMAFKSFLTKFGYHDVVNLATATAAGTNLFTMFLGPYYQTTDEVTYPKPYHIVGRFMFQLWRGNFRVRVKFVKTKLHTARIAFCFFPGEVGPAVLADTEYVHRDIVDISAVDELTYELPFTSQFPYLSTQSSDRFGIYGTFQMILVNPLQAPSTVANNINMIVETAMSEDAEFAMPLASNLLLPVAQSGEVGGLVRVSTLSDAHVSPPQTETAQLCIGEKLMSLRQLIRYPGNLSMTRQFVFMATDATGYMAPIFYNPHCIGAASTAGAQSARAGDFLNLIAPYFRFSRGSMRVRGVIKASAPETFSEGCLFTAHTYRGASLNNGLAGLDTSGSNPSFGGDFTIEPNKPFKYTLPAWQSCPMVPLTYVCANTSPNPTLIRQQQSLIIQGYTNLISKNMSVFLQRQPADDYELLSFIGPPAFVTSVSAPAEDKIIKSQEQKPPLMSGHLSGNLDHPLAPTRHRGH